MSRLLPVGEANGEGDHEVVEGRVPHPRFVS